MIKRFSFLSILSLLVGFLTVSKVLLAKEDQFCIFNHWRFLPMSWPDDQISCVIAPGPLREFRVPRGKKAYKCLTSKNPSFLWDLFERRPTNYNLRIKDLVQLPSTKTVRYGLNSLRFRGSMLWNTLPDMIKSAKNDRQFKNRIKDWTGSTCCCIICA